MTVEFYIKCSEFEDFMKGEPAIVYTKNDDSSTPKMRVCVDANELQIEYDHECYEQEAIYIPAPRKEDVYDTAKAEGIRAMRTVVDPDEAFYTQCGLTSK